MGCEEKYTPCGIAEFSRTGSPSMTDTQAVDEDTGALQISFGSSYKTSDFIADTLEEWWDSLPLEEQMTVEEIQIKVDNGPESSGVRTQFLKRMVDFSDRIGRSIHLIYYPPYHSKYNPIERCWGVLEKHWNGAKLISASVMLAWAASMTWKGLHPMIKLNSTIYQKGISLNKSEMKEVEKRLERNPLLPKWDVLIRPA
jgi:hypothetical protein